jgi:DNA-binding response OmpR family regulator
MRIVVADDELSIRLLVTEVLEDEGYVVHAVGDGLSALEAIRMARPALALLDVAMPLLMGDEALRRLRAEGLSVPVVMMTAGTNALRFLEQGATAVLSKPFGIDQLLATVSAALASAR